MSAQEYRRRVLVLYEDHLPSAILRRRELDLTIDHRLGVGFPRERREALWESQQRLHHRQLSTLLLSFVRKVFGSRKPLEEPLYELVLREYGRVLSPAELSAMVDIPMGKLPH